MEVPPEITFRGLEKSAEIETHILKKAAKLDDIHPGIISCRVTVEREQEHQRSGSPYRARVIVRIPPNKELIGQHEPGEGKIDDRLQTAVTEAFNAVQRQLVKTKEMQQGKVKSAPEQELFGLVVRLFREEGYGFIRSVDGREIYFHKNAVLHGGFERLEIGTGVRYFPSEGKQGPQASTVQIVDKPGSRASKVEDSHVEPPEGWKP
jgi:cold shock CspA family protein/ribosome-associated translation inhibitor RaiA